MLSTLFRTAVFYIIVIFSIRLMGKRQVGELQPGELVVTILISELASIPMQDLSAPVANGIIAILVLVALEILLSVLTLKSGFARRLFSGKPAIIIADGVIDQKMMKKLRISIEDLQEGLRQANAFKIENIDYAVMETNGKISVLQKQSATAPTREDLSVDYNESGMPISIIRDGRWQKEGLVETGADKGAIMRKLISEGLLVEDVFLLTLDKQNNYTIIRKEKR